MSYRVSHYAQIPCEPFIAYCDDLKTAKVLEDVLANQHLFLYDNNIIGDYCNQTAIESNESGEWIELENDYE